MTPDFASITRNFEKLRLDLMASNMAHQALLSVLSAEQRRHALAAFASLAVQQEQLAEKMQMPALVAQMQAAHQRLYSGLEGAQKMRDAGLL